MMPDLFGSDPVPLNRPEGFDMQEWKKGHGPSAIDPIVDACLTELRNKYNCKVSFAQNFEFLGSPIWREDM
jgi:hypothetical protein